MYPLLNFLRAHNYKGMVSQSFMLRPCLLVLQLHEICGFRGACFL
uniref:Uncharacterized protein n=1 Tax=Arundo donax TaxID=35708 RepID=A0A0A9E3L3_ARUDO